MLKSQLEAQAVATPGNDRIHIADVLGVCAVQKLAKDELMAPGMLHEYFSNLPDDQLFEIEMRAEARKQGLQNAIDPFVVKHSIYAQEEKTAPDWFYKKMRDLNRQIHDIARIEAAAKLVLAERTAKEGETDILELRKKISDDCGVWCLLKQDREKFLRQD